MADILYGSGLEQLARTHGYRRYLTEAGLLSPYHQENLEEFVLKCEDESVILGVVSWLSSERE